MSLADELMGVVPQRRAMVGVRRRNFLVGDGSAPDVRREERRLKRRLYTREWQRKNAERARANRKRWVDSHQTEMRRAKADWRERNREYVRAYNREYMRRKRREKAAERSFSAWRPQTREERNARQRAYYRQVYPLRRERIAVRQREYRRLHKDRINARRQQLRESKRIAAALQKAALE